MSDPTWTEDDDTIIEGRTTTLVHSGDEGRQFIEQADLGVTDLAWDDLVALVRGAGEDGQLRARLEAAEAVTDALAGALSTLSEPPRPVVQRAMAMYSEYHADAIARARADQPVPETTCPHTNGAGFFCDLPEGHDGSHVGYWWDPTYNGGKTREEARQWARENRARSEPVPDTGADDLPWRRLKTCVEAWPDCESGEYNPACCRFPKSCSCMADPAETPEHLLEDMQ